MFGMILNWLGGGVLSKLFGALNDAYKTKVNAKTEEEKIAAQEHVDTLKAQIELERNRLADVANARAAAAIYPTWMAVLGFMIGFPFALHLLLVGLGTSFAPLIIVGWFDWMLHIPKLPPPLDQSELEIIAFFFGGMVGVSIAGAIAKRVSK